MKKIYWFAILAAVLVAIVFLIRLPEDDWIKDSRGVWIKHGVPAKIPDYVLEQQEAIDCAENLYNSEKEKRAEFNSQCLGVCGNYAVDIVSVPRSEPDDLEGNQCEDFRDGKVNYFIELDKNGKIVRVI